MALALGFALPVGVRGESAPRPNILFILCDDLGYGDVGVFYQNQRAALKDRGVPFFATPQIDALARDGVKLNQHYCGAPVCAPSRASLFTGLTQGHASVRDNQFDKALADTHTLGTVLQQAGYATALIGKWGLQGGGERETNPKPGRPLSEKQADYASWDAYPTRRGFDYYYGYVRHRDGHFHYPKEDGREVWENEKEVSAGLGLCYTTDLFTARAKQWIIDHRKTQPDQPFFLFLAYDTPHAKLQFPPCAYPAGGGLSGGVQWTGKFGAMINTARGTKDSWMYPDIEKATWDHDSNPATPELPWPDVQKRHATNVRRIDDSVGDLSRLLKDLKIDDNTLVVFSSDNGPSDESYLTENYRPTFFRGFGPFDGIKRDTLEGGERVPTLARWPGGIPAGRVDNHPSGQWDWLASFAELAGVPIPAVSDGVSLVPALAGRGRQRDSTLYVEYFNAAETPNYEAFAPAHRGRTRGQMQTVYLNGCKGVRYDVKSADDDFEIYDLAKDPQEANNLGKDPKFSKLQALMKARVLCVRMPDSSAPRPYDNALVPSLAGEPAGKPGLSWEMFKGEWPWLPDFDTLEKTSAGSATASELSMKPASGPFGVVFRGYFHAAQDGAYTFTLGSDTGAMLFIHDIRLIGETRKNSAGTFSGRVLLKAGWHPIRLLYRHAGEGEPRVDLRCETGGGEAVDLDAINLRQLAAKVSDPRIEAVWLAQTHVMQPDQPYFKLTGNRDALLKVDVVSPSGAPSPEVVAIIASGGETSTLKLTGPETPPQSLPSEPGVVRHRFEDSFTAMIPARLVRRGMTLEVRAGSSTVHHDINVGAPTVVKMKMFDVHYFTRGTNDYPAGLFKELESKWPVAELKIERVRGINFPEMVMPARAGLPAVRISSPEEYTGKTGKKFDGEQAAALQWVWALSRAGGNRDVAMCYINILGVHAGGQAGGFNGVGTIRPGIMNHELGHALGLPHIGQQRDYPYRGEMYGIQPPQVFNEVHVGPTWAFDLPSKTFIPPTVQRGSARWSAGRYKADPMQGGGDGDQEAPFLLRHFSDYNVHRMQEFLERHVAVLRDGSYHKWDDATGDYMRKVENDGVHYPIAQDVPVISVMAAMTMSSPDVNMVYPPIGPYQGNLIRTFDPRSAGDREEARKFFSPEAGCDFTLKVTQGGKERFYLLPASATDKKHPNALRDLTTAAVNLRADDGQVTAVELLYTPKGDEAGMPVNPQVLARWPKG